MEFCLNWSEKFEDGAWRHAGGVRGQLRGQVLRAARGLGPVHGGGGGDVDRRGPQVPAGGARAAAEAVSTTADVRRDPPIRIPVASAVLLQSVRRILRLPGRPL